MSSQQEKNERIRQTLLLTREKRHSQICKVFELKIDDSHLNQKEREQLKMFFVEAKWLYNHILNQDDVFKYDYKTNPIQKKNKDGEMEDVILKFLPAKNRQDVFKSLCQNIKALSRSKRKGKKVGKLKFRREVNSIDLSQYGITHKIISRNRIKVNGIKKPLLVRGLHQITPEMEIANAKLIRKPDGYYIKLTTFHFPRGEVSNEVKKSAVGLDFGIQNNITTSEGEIFNVRIEESERLKRLQKKFSKSKKGSNNRRNLQNLIRIEYQKLDNRKQDASNKIVHSLFSRYHQVVIQDENLRGWQSSKMRGWGRRIQHSAMGRIKSKLRASPRVFMIDRFLPTTKMCPQCGNIKAKNILSERWFTCDCGYSEDRDIKSAKMILKLGLIKIGAERIESKPLEIQTSQTGACTDLKSRSMKEEASKSKD